jgi:hypothetical protein
VAATFEDSGFDAAGAVRHLVGRDAGQHHRVQDTPLSAGAGRQEHPRCQKALAGQGEAELTRILGTVTNGTAVRFVGAETLRSRHGAVFIFIL